MKKIMLPLLAVILAIGFSAFSAEENKSSNDLWFYYDGDFEVYEGTDCGPGNVNPCSVDHPDPMIIEQVPLYTQAILNDLYRVKYGF